MKKLLILIIWITAIQSQAQVQLFSENFEGVNSFTLNSSDVSSSSAINSNQWIVNNSYAGGILNSCGVNYTAANSPTQPSGINNNPNSNYLHIVSNDGINSNVLNANYRPSDGGLFCVGDENYFAKMSSDISTIGYDSINFSFWWTGMGSAENYGELYYSVDGGVNWTQQITGLYSNNAWVQLNTSNPNFVNQATLRFGFRFVNAFTLSVTPIAFSVDDIGITGFVFCSTTSSTITETACNSYTSPSGNIYTTSNTYTDTIPNSLGCDSLITINLTINNVSDLTTSTSGTTISSNNSLGTFQWLDCDNSFAIITNETGQSFTATANGNYAVQLAENGCMDTSACVAITTVGILENTFSDAFTLYPNPTSGIFSIEFGSPQANVELKIMDLSGKVIENKTFDNVVLIEHVIDEPEGVYLIEVSNGKGERSMIRLIKQ